MVFVILVVLWCGWLFFVCGWVLIINCSLNMFILIVIGIGVVWIYSMVVVLVSGIFFLMFRVVDGFVDVYFEVVVVIMVLVFLG